MKRLVFLVILSGVFLQIGCKAIGVMISPTREERKIAAEYDLGEEKERKILVLVKQGGWLGAEANLRYYVMEAINRGFMKKIKIVAENLVSYDELSSFRSGRSDFSLLSPVDIGKALDCELVLLVTIGSYELGEIAETGYYRGAMGTRCVLFETSSGEKLWPEATDGKSVRVGSDVEQGGKKVAVSRLAGAFAHCIVRYFYDCPEAQFKIADDRSDINW